jgi:hypothetical protein
VTDGSAKFSVALFGQYMAAGFAVATDGQTGSTITYAEPAQQSPFQLAPGHH